ncbi:MAG: hypothetical protein ACO1NX_09395, partial [Chitinophagaceae bacterium]
MNLSHLSTYIFRTVVFTAVMLLCCFNADAYYTPDFSFDTTIYPIKDRRGDPYTYGSRHAFDLSDTSFIKRNIEYDPVSRQYF